MVNSIENNIIYSSRPVTNETIINVIACMDELNQLCFSKALEEQTPYISNKSVNVVFYNSCKDFFYILDEYKEKEIKHIDIFITHNHEYGSQDTEIVTSTAKKIMDLQKRFSQKLYLGLISFSCPTLPDFWEVLKKNAPYFDFYYFTGAFYGESGVIFFKNLFSFFLDGKSFKDNPSWQIVNAKPIL